MHACGGGAGGGWGSVNGGGVHRTYELLELFPVRIYDESLFDTDSSETAIYGWCEFWYWRDIDDKSVKIIRTSSTISDIEIFLYFAIHLGPTDGPGQKQRT
jgi:hypothetical protein